MTLTRKFKIVWSIGLLFFVTLPIGWKACGLGFVVNYVDDQGEGFFDPTLGEQRRIAFEFALSIWAAEIPSDATLTLEAQFDPLGGSFFGATLAFAGPRYLVTIEPADVADFPTLIPNTVYTGSQASAVAGR